MDKRQAFGAGRNAGHQLEHRGAAVADGRLRVGMSVLCMAAQSRGQGARDGPVAHGQGELRVSLDGETAVLTLAHGARKQKAVFDRFGIAIYEGGGQWSTVYLDDLQYTTGSPTESDPRKSSD